METTTFTSTPTFPDSWNTTWKKAKQGIRFITPGYKELFRIPDGDHIRIFTGGGETRDRTCRFIDETHFETSGGYSSALYHICEFAERLEQTHGSVIRCVLLCLYSALVRCPHPGADSSDQGRKRIQPLS